MDNHYAHYSKCIEICSDYLAKYVREKFMSEYLVDVCVYLKFNIYIKQKSLHLYFFSHPGQSLEGLVGLTGTFL